MWKSALLGLQGCYERIFYSILHTCAALLQGLRNQQVELRRISSNMLVTQFDLTFQILAQCSRWIFARPVENAAKVSQFKIRVAFSPFSLLSIAKNKIAGT